MVGKELPGEYGEAYRRAAEAAARAAGEPVRRHMEGVSKSLNIGAAISPKVLEDLGLAQERMAAHAASVVANASIGISEQLEEATGRLAREYLRIVNFGTVKPIDLEELAKPHYPENLIGIEGLELALVEDVALNEGLPLYGVPSEKFAVEILNAQHSSARRDLISQYADELREDCMAALSRSAGRVNAEYVHAAQCAADAHRAGNYFAAQALAGTVVDSIIRRLLKSDRSNYTPSPKGDRTTEAFEELDAPTFIALAPMWMAYGKYFAEQRDPVPETFNRNASAHSVSSSQFTRVNATQGLMFACSLILYGGKDLE